MKPALLRWLAAVSLCFLIASGAVLSLDPGRTMRDFSTFVKAGAAYKQGLNPYKAYLEFPEGSGAVSPTEDPEHSPNLNPPISLYPFRLLADMDWTLARNLVNVASIALYAGVCYVLLRVNLAQKKPLVVLWLMALSGLWFTLLVGQIYMLLLLLGVSALLLLERGRNILLAGVLIGLLVTIKPNFVLWPLLLLVAGHRKPAIASFLVAAVISAIPSLIEGPEIYAQWLDAAAGYPRAAIAPNAAIFGETTRLGVPALGFVIAACLIAAGAFYAWRGRFSAREASVAGIMITLLVGPLTWLGYTLLSLPLLLSRRWGGWELAVAATMVVPAGLDAPAGEVRLAGLLVLTGLAARDAIEARRLAARPSQASDTIAVEAA